MFSILIINSSPLIGPLKKATEYFRHKKYDFYLLSGGNVSPDPERGWRVFLGPPLDSGLNLSLFVLLLPFLCSKQLLNLVYFKYKKRVKRVVCVNWNEKIVFTPMAGLLGLKVIWVELPTVDYDNKPLFLLRLYRSCAGKVRFVVFLNVDKFKLVNLGIDFERIKKIPPAIDIKSKGRQENIFSRLALSEYSSKETNAFTIGAVDTEHSSQIENLLKAVKSSLDIIPRLRVVVLGKNERKKYLLWLAEKMEIEDLIWPVGEQGDLYKWMSNFDIFIGLSEKPDMFDLEIMLEAMVNEVPVIGLRNKGYEELIEENRNGVLVNSNDGEALSQRMIRLFQDPSLRRTMAQRAAGKVTEEHTREKQLEELEAALK